MHILLFNILEIFIQPNTNVFWYIYVIGTIGGILSLLLGINIINIFEILYVVIQILSNLIDTK